MANDRKELVEQLAALMEQGQLPWDKGFSAMRDYNGKTGASYTGGNIVRLMVAAKAKDYADPRWMTFNQAKEQGAMVRKGEKGTRLEFWKQVGADDKAVGKDTEEQDGKTRSKMIGMAFYVFNAAQIDGLPELAPAAPVEVSQLEAMATRMIDRAGFNVVHERVNEIESPRYMPSRDLITMPLREQFQDATAYLATLFHEAAHATGHESRLAREGITEARTPERYAREELVAELASVFLSADLGIPRRDEHHAAYLKSWASMIRDDPNALFRAARDAEKAVDLIKELGKEVLQEAQQDLDNVKSATVDQARTYTGPIVGITDSHALQNTGRSTIAHPLDRLPAGIQVDGAKPVQIEYAKGRAEVRTPTQAEVAR